MSELLNFEKVIKMENKTHCVHAMIWAPESDNHLILDKYPGPGLVLVRIIRINRLF